MDLMTCCILVAYMTFQCNAVTFKEQLDHIIKRRRESSGVYGPIPSRRLEGDEMSVILGAPSMPSHLPEAEPILPGHTLLRPARDVLKSAIKFPHRDPGDGAGVYGNVHNLGIRYDGRNERVAYSGFRRMPNDILEALQKSSRYQTVKPKFSLSSFLELSDKSEEYVAKPLRNVKPQRVKRFKGIIIKVKPSKQGTKYIKNRGRTDSRNNHQKKHDTIVNEVPASYHENMFQKINTQKPKKKRFGPPGQRPRKDLHLKTLLDSLRRDRKEEIAANTVNNNMILLPDDESSNEDYPDKEAEDKKKEESREFKGKSEWFWNSKDIYNNIKLNLDAPELAELIPEDKKEDLRQWWFFHQDDFLPFKS